MFKRSCDATQTLSARVIDDMLSLGGTWNMGSHFAKVHTQDFEQHALSVEKQDYFAELAQQSIQAQQQLEQQTQQSFLEYLKQFR